MRSSLRVLTCLAGLLAACTDQVVSPDGSTTGQPQSASLAVQATSSDDIQRLARALAAGMGSPQIRTQVLRAMRASRVTEHKLVWQDFVRTVQGRALMAAAARGAGATSAELEAISLRLPELDFYMPAREHRLTWKGSADLLVAGTVGARAPTVGYSPQRSSVPLNLRLALPTQVLFVLQPAERKSVRIRIQARKDGPTIQDPDDGDESGTMVLIEAGKDPVVLPLSDRISPKQECIPDINGGGCNTGGGGGGWTPTPDVTRIPSFYTYDVTDNDNPYEGNEFEFHSRYYLASGSLARYMVYRREGVRPNTLTTTNNAVLIDRRIRENTAETIKVTLIETDGWPNPDDNFGVSTIKDNPTGPSSPQGLKWYHWYEGASIPTVRLGVTATVMWELKY